MRSAWASTLLLVWSLLSPDIAVAQTTMEAAAPSNANPAAGNLPAGFYPKPGCVAPSRKWLSPPASREWGDVNLYNRNVEKFNKGSVVYNDCMRAYNAKVGNDVQGILSAVNGEVAAAMNRPAAPPPDAAGNMPLGFYPPSGCKSPDRAAIGVQPSTSDHAGMTAYNLRVKTFNDQVTAFNDCLKTYREKAQQDIAEIRNTSREAATGAP